MPHKSQSPVVLFALVIILISLACATLPSLAPTPAASTDTSTSESLHTVTPSPSATQTRRPSPTLRPTKTPDFAATTQAEEWNVETQKYFDLGYLKTAEGEFTRLDDFNEEWAQMGWYQWWPEDISASDFYMSGHFKWSSAYRGAETSGCGFVFGMQDNENQDHYAVFLDWSRVEFLIGSSYIDSIGPTRGTGHVNFGNPADKPVEADFTLIVKDAYAYVLVDGEVAGEYTLSQSRPSQGGLGLTMLSGTNKDYGTRCEMTNLRIWIPKE